MTRPLLVIIITDGEIEGEPKGRLKKVITRTAAKLSEAKPYTAHAVSYQFAKVGDDSRATRLFEDLDNDIELSPYIDCLLQSKLEDLDKKDKKWHVIHKLLLGAIYPPLDKKNSAADPDYDDQGAVPTLAPVMVQNEDELEEEDEVEDYINEDESENQDG
ncbi:hypothetical protein K440DRAFT_629680 [Wilcoxina mikolae CBS 423.85]|nr:hypothetical protein K440DRAFT_629680 [Wilcoxina mikolae CBS 423.85]